MGLDTSVEASEIYMVSFDTRFLDRLSKLGININLYKRYVDDITIVLKAIGPGWHYCSLEDRIKFDRDGPYCDLEKDQRTMSILRDIGNSIDMNIQLTFDCPSLNTDHRLPILDIKVWMEDHKLRHTFYRKECSSNLTIMKRSAIGKNVKRTSLFEEGMRRLRNMDVDTTEEEKKRVLGAYMNCLRLSGHQLKFRRELLNGILIRRKDMDREIREKGVPRYRNRAEIDLKKLSKKDNHLATWFLRGTNTSVLQVQATPGGALANIVKNTLRGYKAPDGGTTMVVEMGGRS